MLVSLPKGFIGLQFYPGYFYNQTDTLLYSIKSGTLKPLKLQKPYKNAVVNLGYHYTVSINGWRKYISVDYLKNLKENQITYKVNVQ